MKQSIALSLLSTSLALAPAAWADVLALKNGATMTGRYLGGTDTTVRFETPTGIRVIETGQIVTLTFTAPAPPVAQAAPVATPLPAGTVTLPAGTTLLVRMMDSVSSKSRPGTSFATRLEYDLGGGGTVAVKGGTVIYGRVQSATQAGRAIGRSTLDLRLVQMVVNGQQVPISTSGHQEAGQASIAKAAKGAAAGAAIGAIAGDAGKGAAIGATAGALLRGQTVTVSPGTLLEFALTQPVTFNLGG